MKGTVVCDLDGVAYVGEQTIDGVGDALRSLEADDWHVLFATNNSARKPADVVEKLRRVVGYEATVDQVITSSLVAASLVEKGPVLVMGEDGIEVAVTEAGHELTDDPTEAGAVIVGLDRGISYDRITRAADAARAGAQFIATNHDPTFPTEYGLKPGAGACIAAVETASGLPATRAGKPSDAMRRMIESRCPEGPIWMIGDRPDTDLAMTAWPRWHSALVLTGVTTTPEDVNPTPDVVAADLPTAVRSILSS